uniref:Armadillo repeat containing 4 n=1 Tax=Anabas testudineus TaxID=64144 RepID=A0A7N6C1B4_ANATE
MDTADNTFVNVLKGKSCLKFTTIPADKMGILLSRAAQWTTASSGTGKLAFTPMNESLLEEILCFVEQFNSQHPQEAEHVFDEPLQWRTTLVASDFKTDYDISNLGVQSSEKDSKGHPLLLLSPPTVYVRSFSQLSKLVNLADKKLDEIRACLEENRDPLVKILGTGFAKVLEREDDTDALLLEDKGKDERLDSEVKVMLFHLLQNIDKQLLNKLLEKISEQVRLDPTAVKTEVELLKQFCSKGENRLLKSVQYTSDYEFLNGCRAPLWRQVHGEMFYLVIEPYDTEKLYITCSNAGVFLNGGIKQMGQESGYERTSEVFKDLLTLLKNSLHNFAENINKQDFAVQEMHLTQMIEHVESVDAEEQGQPQRSYEQQENNVDNKARQQHMPIEADGEKTYEPCPRWKNLVLLSLCGKTEEANPSKRSGEEKSGEIQNKKLGLAAKSKMKAEFSVSSLHGRVSSQKIKTPGRALPVELFSESSSESEEEEEQAERRPESNTDLPAEYWQIQKLVKYLKGGDPTATVLTLCAMMDFNLMQEACSKSTKNKEAIRKAEGIPLLGRLLKSPHENMLIPVVGTLQECASEERYRIAIQTEGMIKDLVKNLSSDSDELQMHCASAIFKCAEDKQTRDLVRKYRGLQPLVSLLEKADNEQLLAAATGAIWKCSISMENVAKFQEYKALEILVGLLTDQPEEVLVNVVGALGEFAQIPANKATIRKCGGIKPLVNLLTGTNQALLVNVTKAVGACATDKDNMAIIDQLDGVRLVWSLLKNPNADVQSGAAWALCPCIENAKDAGEMVRSLVGGLELIVNLLNTTNNEVLASICASIAKIAKDKENLAVLTDHGVVPLLAKLTNTSDDRLRRYLAEAIGHCCIWGSNRSSFGDAGAVAPLVHYLKSKDSAVHQSTAMALYQLSKDPSNCITMHERGVVKPLIHIMGSNDEMLQEAAAGCVRNIRLLAMANRKARLFQ